MLPLTLESIVQIYQWEINPQTIWGFSNEYNWYLKEKKMSKQQTTTINVIELHQISIHYKKDSYNC